MILDFKRVGDITALRAEGTPEELAEFAHRTGLDLASVTDIGETEGEDEEAGAEPADGVH